MTEKNNKKYEWVGDVDSYKEPEQNEHSVKYNEPNRDYDSDYKPHTSCIEPNIHAYRHIGNEWIIYPWERDDSEPIQDYKL